MEGTATVSQAPTYGSAATLQYNTSTDRINGIEWPTAFTATGGVLIKNTGKITLDKARTYTLSKLTIDPGFLIIPAGGQVSVTGDTKITSANGLTIESVSEVSGGAGTGSFITGTTSGSGTASVIRYMSPRSWHMVSSPVSGQTITGFLGSNGNIPKNVAPGAPTELHVERGMRDYNPSINQWNSFFTDETTGSIEKGKGFLVRVKGSTGTKDVTFSGTLNAGPLSATGLTSNLWNCVGNPYTSALKLNINSGTDNFIDGNTANLDMTYGGIYIWHQSNEVLDDDQATGAYEAVSNASLATEVQQGQAFMVKMASTASTLNFTYAMQSHNTGLALKSTNNIWPTIKLTATSDSITSSTIIAFHEGMTPGLDPTYDAGLLKGGASVEVYTRLVEDNGIPFDIQALPANFESTVVPVGIDCTKGSQVSFSAELMHVPSNCQAILEDRLTDTFTDLSVNSYTADLKGSASSQDRFFLHTSYATTGIDSRNRIQQLRAWAISNQEIKISGQVGNKAIATLYDLQGRTVAICPLQAGNLNRVPLNGLKQGVFMLRVQDDQRAQVLKVIIQK
ncbi:MAG TPA: T9SS type A sorting domain-containing protein [Prolixibacteraceae bacterium]|nr:T9SS type A sorting domain-containing protein [Prolixibacteraceae bacterium]